jgi:hypothetical protein
MKHVWFLRVIATLLLLVGIAAVGILAYQAGLAQAAIINPAGQAVVQAPSLPHGGFFPGLFLLPFLLCAAPLFLGFFICLPMRIFFGPHHAFMGHFRRWHGEDGVVPSPFEEWHRRAHESKPKE